MESFHQLLPPHAKVLRDGKVRGILASELVVGDVILLEEGDKVPADGRLIDINSLKVDNSALTGESEPQLRSLECAHPNLLECRNMVFSGTLVQSENGKAVIFGIGQNTQIGSLATLTERTGKENRCKAYDSCKIIMRQVNFWQVLFLTIVCFVFDILLCFDYVFVFKIINKLLIACLHPHLPVSESRNGRGREFLALELKYF